MREWLPELSVLVDTSLLVLIWMVQIIIYPSFKFMGGTAFKQWHAKYTRLMTFFVAPLMLLQLVNTSLWIFHDINAINIIRAVLVGYIWVNTFFIAVPIHAKLDIANETQIHKDNLIQTNWPRAAAWTLIFFLSLYQYIIINT